MYLPRQTGWSSDSGRSLYDSSGNTCCMSCLNPASNSRLPQHASAKMKPPCSTNSLRFWRASAVNSGGLWPLKKTIGAWSSSGTLATFGSTTCQVSRLFQLCETTLTMFLTSSESFSQSPRGPWRSLLIRTGARPFGEKEERKAGREHGIGLDEAASPGAVQLVLVMHQLLGAEAIPVVLTEEANAREPAGTLETVQVVELPLMAGAEVLSDLKMAGEPIDASLEASIHASRAALLD